MVWEAMVSKVFMGVRLQRLREERKMTQAALAKTLGISPSYLNQIERNQRPLTVPILLRIGDAMGVDPQIFSEHGSAGLVADLQDVFGELPDSEATSLAELKMLVDNMPGVARGILQLQRRYRMSAERADSLEAQFDNGKLEVRRPVPPSTDEEVRDYLNRRQNYIGELDEAAERIVRNGAADLQARLAAAHGVTVLSAPGSEVSMRKREFDAIGKRLWLPDSATTGQRAFQMAAQIGRLEETAAIESLVHAATLSSNAARDGLRLALSNYFAGAVLMPYTRFLQAAEACGYDIGLLAHQFGVGFEAVCHRLSTLQRPGHAGLPMFFVRVDRAGNVSKRQSATAFHFSRVGGTCPLWIVYEAFSYPTQVLRQVARMPDGSTYLWIARQVQTGPAGFNLAGKSFAVALGCDISQAHRLVYAKGLDLHDPSVATPIGTGCKVCERTDCLQRAFPSVLLPLKSKSLSNSAAAS
jgi:predicted transcriptional regulator/DNA-binding XRE family transcriptional regulator